MISWQLSALFSIHWLPQAPLVKSPGTPQIHFAIGIR